MDIGKANRAVYIAEDALGSYTSALAELYEILKSDKDSAPLAAKIKDLQKRAAAEFREFYSIETALASRKNASSSELVKIAKLLMAKRIALTSMMESALKADGYDEDFIGKADDFMFDNPRAMGMQKEKFLRFIHDNESVIKKGNF